MTHRPRSVRSRATLGTTGAALLLPALACTALAGCPRRSRANPTTDRSDGQLPQLRAPRVAPGAIRIDGRLDEAAWQHAGETGWFVDTRTGRPAPASRVNAAGRVAWDDANLYVGVTVYDGNPDTAFRATDLDPHVWERSSAIELMIQPGDLGDNRDYYEIQVDTAGAIWDTHFDNYNQPITGSRGHEIFGHQEWSSAIRQASVVDRSAGHYTVELAVPWASFQNARSPVPPRAGDTWRVNMYSFREGQSDALGWSPTLGRGNFHFAPRFGRVTFAASP